MNIQPNHIELSRVDVSLLIKGLRLSIEELKCKRDAAAATEVQVELVSQLIEAKQRMLVAFEKFVGAD